MRRALFMFALLGLAGCVPSGEDALTLCREDAVHVLEIADSDQQRRKNGYIEHCMRTFGYSWNEKSAACPTGAAFRRGAPLSDDPAVAATCFRSASEQASPLADLVSGWLD